MQGGNESLLPDLAWRQWLDDSLKELSSSHQLRVLRPLVATSSGVRVRWNVAFCFVVCALCNPS